MSKTEISKIVLKSGGKKIELSLKEAHELKDILNDTFPKKEIEYNICPVVIEKGWPPYNPYRPYDVWYGTAIDSTLYLSSSVQTTG